MRIGKQCKIMGGKQETMGNAGNAGNSGKAMKGAGQRLELAQI